jgi:sulfur carrier protein
MTVAIRLNGKPQAVAAGSVAELLTGLGIDPARRGLAVALNGAVLPRDRWAETGLAGGDTLEIVRPMAGG